MTITNDGATILKQMQVFHPAAKMVSAFLRSTIINLKCLIISLSYICQFNCLMVYCQN